MTTEWLTRALEESRARGFLGPGPIDAQITHAQGFALCWEDLRETPPSSFLDLGSGGGIPGLVLLERWNTVGVLADSMNKRTDFLREVLSWPDAPHGGHVETARMEDLARVEEMGGTFELVTARSFGPPAVVAECATRFLSFGGLLIVSEPPDDTAPNRWPEKGLAKLGLADRGRTRFGAAYEVVEKVRPTPPAYPREVGVPGKKPLF